MVRLSPLKKKQPTLDRIVESMCSKPEDNEKQQRSQTKNATPRKKHTHPPLSKKQLSAELTEHREDTEKKGDRQKLETKTANEGTQKICAVRLLDVRLSLPASTPITLTDTTTAQNWKNTLETKKERDKTTGTDKRAQN